MILKIMGVKNIEGSFFVKFKSIKVCFYFQFVSRGVWKFLIVFSEIADGLWPLKKGSALVEKKWDLM